jgi:hypothetical protein
VGPPGFEPWTNGCNPTVFSGVVNVALGVLGPRHGGVKVDLVELGHEPMEFLWTKIVTRQIFRDILQG